MTNIISRLPLVRRLVATKPALTPGDVKDFWAFMSKTYGTRIINKNNAAEMKAVGELLRIMGVMDKEAFLKNYTTTLGKTIYIPKSIGFEDANWSLWGQVVICVHEHIHVYQDEQSGGLIYEWQYVTNSADRANYEAEAYRADMELSWRYQGSMPSAKSLAAKLKNYACTNVDIKVAEKQLALSIPAIKAGVILHPVTKVAIGWLDVRLAA